MDVAAIQAALADEGVDAWLLYDFRGTNAIATSLVGIPPEKKASRRWFWLVPREGEPTAIVSAVEPHVLPAPGRRVVYRSWRELDAALREALAGCRTVAMEVSPGAAVPTVSRVDWGTVEWIRSLGVEVVSSGDLVQFFDARWTPEQKALHDTAAAAVLAAKDALLEHVGARIGAIAESAGQAFLLERFAEWGVETTYPPCVAVNEHGADPHFETASGRDDRTISRGDVLLVDLWAKVAGEPHAVYADVTWMAFCGPEPPARVVEAWEAVRDGRDAAVELVRTRVAAGETLHGYEVDRAARDLIESRGFGELFVHRTGHSLGTEVHGNGVNMDDLETRDERRLIAGLGFTIEPGVYLPGEFGVRSEVNLFVGESAPEVTTEEQRDLTLLG